MTGIEILERIVQEEGSCNWAAPSVCDRCPLGRLVRSDDGKYMSCVEALNIDGLSDKEQDARYKEAAASKLVDMTLEQIIEAT